MNIFSSSWIAACARVVMSAVASAVLRSERMVPTNEETFEEKLIRIVDEIESNLASKTLTADGRKELRYNLLRIECYASEQIFLSASMECRNNVVDKLLLVLDSKMSFFIRSIALNIIKIMIDQSHLPPARLDKVLDFLLLNAPKETIMQEVILDVIEVWVEKNKDTGEIGDKVLEELMRLSCNTKEMSLAI